MKPLFGKKILLTRSKEQSLSLATKLIRQGVQPINCPIVNYELIEKEIYSKNIISNIPTYDWIFFISQNAVKYFFEIMDKNCYDSRALSRAQIAAVGYKTKLELEKYNIKTDFVPKRFSFKDLVKELNEKNNLQDKKILLPTQVGTLHATPLNITEWPIYKANFVDSLEPEIINQIKEGIDVITLFSSNTVIHLAELFKKHKLLVRTSGHLSLLATIGDETAKTVRDLFGRVDIIAEPFTEDGLIESMERFYAKHVLKIQTTTAS